MPACDCVRAFAVSRKEELHGQITMHTNTVQPIYSTRRRRTSILRAKTRLSLKPCLFCFQHEGIVTQVVHPACFSCQRGARMLSSRVLFTHCRQRPVRECGATSLSRRDCVASSFDAGCKSRQENAANFDAGLCFGLRWPRRDLLLQSFAALLAITSVLSGTCTVVCLLGSLLILDLLLEQKYTA